MRSGGTAPLCRAALVGFTPFSRPEPYGARRSLTSDIRISSVRVTVEVTMRIFVAGATGVIGRRAVVQLIAAGHVVTGVARTPNKAAALRRAGAAAVDVSLFDPVALRAAVAGHDAVVNLATKIPTFTQAARDSAWEENTRIRVEGSRNLVDAALAAGATVFVQESIAFVYGEHGDAWIDASTTELSASPFTEPVRAAEASTARFTAAGGRGVVLRFGTFQASESHHATSMFKAARRGFVLDLGDPNGYFPAVDADDAARAVVAALDVPAGVYDIVDDEPITRHDAAVAFGRAVGRRRLRRVPGANLAAAKAGPLTNSQRVSNNAFRAASGWRPEVRNRRDAIAKMAGELDIAPALGRATRILLWLLAASGLAIGVYAEFFPRAFYDDFPFGRNWVAHDGPYNEHLIRDFGAMNLALAAVTLVALYYATRAAARAAAIGWIVFSVPHAVYHFRNLGHYDTADQIGNVVTLTFGVALAVAALATSYSGAGEPVSEHAAAGVRNDDLRRDVGPRRRDRVDQPGPGVS
jgi:nucleoside-diphosphate-sugar epimerase